MSYGEWIFKNYHIAIAYFIGWVIAQFVLRAFQGINNPWIESILILVFGFSVFSYIFYLIDKKGKHASLDESDKN
jgi:hypothetical protein